MKKIFTLIFLIMVIGFATTSQVIADDTWCSGTLGAVTVDNLIVDGSCTLNGTTIEGNLVLKVGSEFSATNASILGNVVQADGAAQIKMIGTDVAGNIQLKRTVGPLENEIISTTIGGDLQLEENEGAFQIRDNYIGGSLQVYHSTGGVNIVGNQINANLQCKDNAPAPTGDNNTVGGNKEDQCAVLEPAMVSVPDVVGQPQADAEAAIIAVYLTAGAISTAPNETVPIGHVISQDPSAGTSIVEGSTVDLVVSLGPEPTVNISAEPQTIVVGEPFTLSWETTHAGSCVIEPGIGPVDVNSSITLSPSETTTYTITATGLGGTASANTTVNVEQPSGPPTVNFSVSPATIAQGESATLSWNSVNAENAHIDNGIGIVNLNDSISVSPELTATYTLTVTGQDGSSNAEVTVKVTGNPEPQPEGHFGEQYEDLVPPDATVEEYDPKRFSVITGLVQDLTDLPIADVSITIHSHPEYGTVTTGAEGRFSIPVEGGATMTVVYQKDGLIPAQRKVYVPWNDIAIAETIQMIAEDPVSTTLTFDGNPDTVVTHQSTEVTDEFGSRSASMVFTGDNRAYLVDENGNDVMELTTITTRATEYTTPESMPAVLPPTSAYTYCVELGVDGAQRVRFEKPVILWVDNFLGFDVGMAVPVGFYDRDRGVWVPEKNGQVVKLLDTDSDGVVDALDENGDDLPDDLDQNGSFSDEVKGLENQLSYPPNTTYWRVAMNHFSPWDLNWARRIIASYTPLEPHGPEGSISPNPKGETVIESAKPEETVKPPEKEKCLNSYVENRSRIFHEDIAIPGTGITLHYAGNRVEGYRHGLSVPASGSTVPDGLIRIIVKIEVAGRKFEQILPPLPDQKADFIWDGLDHLGRRVNSAAAAKVNIGFEYEAVYTVPPELERAFAALGRELTDILTRENITLWKPSEVFIPVPPIQSRGTVAEGWALSSHHYLSPADPSTLHKGDSNLIRNSTTFISTVAGTGTYGYSHSLIATQQELYYPQNVAVDAAGNFYIADKYNSHIRKVDKYGNISTVVGVRWAGFSGDGGSAYIAQIYRPYDIAIDAKGNLYIADSWNYRIRKVDSNGIITTVAGNGSEYYSGDGGPAIQAGIGNLYGIAVDADGNLYIADGRNHVIRKVDTSGIISTVAGTLFRGGYSGDGGLSIHAQIGSPKDVAVDTAGNLYITDGYNDVVRMVDTSGIISTVAGNGTAGYSGDGGMATQAQLNGPNYLSVDTIGNLYISEYSNPVIRMVDTKGIIRTVAGNGTAGYSGDGGSPLDAQIRYNSAVAVDPFGGFYIADSGNHVIRKVGLPSALNIATDLGDIAIAEKSGFSYIMDSAGWHKKTIDLDTGLTLYEFGYDSDKNLVSITDRFGNQTTIARDGNGVPTSITSPDGLTTTLTIDANNHLTRITYPDGSFYGFEYTPDGLMTAKIEPEGNRFENIYDALGRLTDVIDQEGGHWNYSRTTDANGDINTEIMTAEGNLTTILDRTDSTGAYFSTVTGPSGAETLFKQSGDGITVNQDLACGMQLESKYDIDSEYRAYA